MPPFVTTLIERIGGPRRALIALAGLGSAVVVLLLANWAATPTMVPAYANLPVEQAARLDDELTKAAIPHELVKGGTEILVASTDIARSQVALAKAGVLGRKTAGFELFDQQSWGMTDFTQRIQYRRALEGELEATIGEMRGVERAEVSLALNETATYRRPTDTPPRASVVLALTSGTTPTPDVVQGIQHLVASSVGVVTAERVVVLDDVGRMLSLPDDAAGIAGTSSRQQGVQKEVEHSLREKAQAIMDRAVGPGNATVTVTAAISFDKVQRTSSVVDPDRQAISTEQKAEIVPGAEGGAGSTNVATAFENTKTVETFEGAIGSVRRLDVAVLVNHKLVPLVDSTAAAGTAAAGTAAAGTAAAERADSTAARDSVLVPAPRSAEELASLERLVRTAVGADSARGDQVSVVNMPFAPTVRAEAEPAPSLLATFERYQRPALSALGLLLAAVIGVLTLRALKPPVPVAAPASAPPLLAAAATAAAASPASTPLLEAGGGGGGAVLVQKAAPTFRVEVGNTVLRDQTVQVIEKDPDDAARLFRVWLREG
ncbi:MAG: flagellar basal-body MS-ring/collar protein FliF [Gemmatimonadota bacterium]